MIGPTRTPRLVARAHDGAWRPLPPLPATRLLLFTPSLAALGGTGFPSRGLRVASGGGGGYGGAMRRKIHVPLVRVLA